MVNFLIYYKEAVVRFLEDVYTYRGVLQVMLVDIQLQCFRNLHCVYLCQHSICPLVKHGKNGIINIVVNQYDSCSGFSYSVRHKSICIVTFAIIEDSLPARFIFLELGEYFLELLLIFQLLAVKTVEPLEYLRIGNEKSAHGDKCAHNQYVCLYSRFTSQKAGKHGYSLLREDIREISVTVSGV